MTTASGTLSAVNPSTTIPPPTATTTTTTTTTTLNAEIIIPGTFVVLQGSPGDGVMNTMDYLPSPLDEEDDDDIEEVDHDIEEEEDYEDNEGIENDDTEDVNMRMDIDEDYNDDDDDDDNSPNNNHNTHSRIPTQPLGSFQMPTTTLGSLSSLISPPSTAATRTTGTNPSTTTATSTVSLSSAAFIAGRRTTTGGGGGGGGGGGFVVVTDQEDENLVSSSSTSSSSTTSSGWGGRKNNTNPHRYGPKRRELIKEWKRKDRERTRVECQEWKEIASTMLPSRHLFMEAVKEEEDDDDDDENDDDDNRHPFWWLTKSGKLAVFEELPTRSYTTNNNNNNERRRRRNVMLKRVLVGISPGTTLIAKDIHYLDSKTLQPIMVGPLSTTTPMAMNEDNDDYHLYPKGRVGWMIFLHVELIMHDHSNFHHPQSDLQEQQPTMGYIAMNCDGYPLIVPGLPSWYVQPDEWIWRVTCPAGAYVRAGLELNSKHLETLPYGSLVQVSQRTLNSQGLSRLKVSAIVEDTWNISTSPSDTRHPSSASSSAAAAATLSSSSSTTTTLTTSKKRLIQGWCSEGLNPLSGNRGKVLLPLPFPVPAMYIVTLSEGALVRSEIELSSPIMGKVDMGMSVAITRRAFAEHPADQCLERLRLAKGGWISRRLNRPGGDFVVHSKADDTDWAFDTDNPTAYHWQYLRSCDLSTVDSDAVSNQTIDSTTPPRRQPRSPSSRSSSSSGSMSSPPRQQQPQQPLPQQHRSQCLICLSEERNATIVHGETGHIVCCLVCARILKARGDKCPVCRLEIDSVIQHFWA